MQFFQDIRNMFLPYINKTTFINILRNQNFWYLFSRYAIMGIQFITSLFVAVRLGVYNYGIWSFIFLLTTIGSCLNFGIGNALTILLVQHRSDKSQCDIFTYNSFLMACIVGCLGFIVLLYDRIFGIPLFEKYHLNNYIYAVFFSILLQQLCQYFVNLMRVRNNLGSIMVFQCLWPLALLAIIFIARGETLLIFMVNGLLLTSGVSLFIFLLKSRIKWFGRVDWSAIKTIFAKGIFMFFFNTCFSMIAYSTQILISNLYTVEEFGYFSFAFVLANGIVLLLESAIFLLYPKLLEILQNKTPQDAFETIKKIRLYYLASIYLIFLTALLGQFLFFMIFPQYQQSSFAFGIILCSLISYSGCFGYNTYLLVKNHEKFIAATAFTALCFNILTMLFLAKILHLSFAYSLLGALLSYRFYSFAITYYALKKLNPSKKKFFSEIINWKFSLTFWIAFFCLCRCNNFVFMLIPLIVFILLLNKSILAALKKCLNILTDNKILKI